MPYGGGGNSYFGGRSELQRSIHPGSEGQTHFAAAGGVPQSCRSRSSFARTGLKSEEFRLYNLAGEAGQAALVSGSVDAYFGGVDAYLLEEKGLARIIWSTKEPVNGTKIARSRVDSRTLARTSRASSRSSRSWSRQRTYEPPIGKRRRRTKRRSCAFSRGRARPARVLKRDQDGEIISWRDRWSPLFDDFLYDGFRSAVAVSLERRLLTRSVDVDEYLDPRFARQALRDLKIEGLLDTASFVGHHERARSSPRASPSKPEIGEGRWESMTDSVQTLGRAARADQELVVATRRLGRIHRGLRAALHRGDRERGFPRAGAGAAQRDPRRLCRSFCNEASSRIIWR